MVNPMGNPIRRLLIANRGEIACRIMRTAKRMNIETLTVFSSADRDAMHVHLADQALFIGDAEPQKSYLDQDKIIEIAHKYDVSAIHPGYGFLSENAEFSRRCQKENLIFVGPNAESIRTMGIKNESKRIMIAAGVPVVPGYHGANQEDKLLLEEARKIGYPVLIKPVRGGGGKGMRIVYREKDFLENLESSRRESLKSFNDQSILLEKFIEKPRHVEVQVFGDTHGNYVYLYERDCSVQRRHQKIIEEAPAPLFTKAKQADIGKQAVAAAKVVGYIGAGTVEFIVDKNTEEFYFMEMNTRLQVEHPITEMITGADLVEWQLRVASGEKLPKQQDQIEIDGHAFEARIYAEDPDNDFLPQTGLLTYISSPASNGNDKLSKEVFDRTAIRLDTGVSSGDVISPYYDPMIAKLIVWDHDRITALNKLTRALQQYVVIGVPTNINFLIALTKNPSFREANVGTDFIDEHKDELFNDKHVDTDWKHSLPELCVAIHEMISLLSGKMFDRELTSYRLPGIPAPKYKFKVKLGCSKAIINVEYESHSALRGNLTIIADDITANDTICLPMMAYKKDRTFTLKLNGGKTIHNFDMKSDVSLNESENEFIIVVRDSAGVDRVFIIENNNNLQKKNSVHSDTLNPLIACSPMPGIVEKVLVKVGDIVKKDQSLIIVSAMKMEYTVKSEIDGRVSRINHKAGAFVPKETPLVQLSEI